MEKNQDKSRMIIHDISACIKAIENAFHGATENPHRKADYGILLEKANARVLRIVTELLERSGGRGETK